MFYHIKSYLQRGITLTVIAIVGLVGIAYLYVSASGSHDEAAELETQRVAALAELETQKSRTADETRKLTQKRQELDERNAQLGADRQIASIAALTTSRDAKGLGNRVINYAVLKGLVIVDSQIADTVTVITEEETLTYIDEDASNIRRISETCERLESDEPSGELQIPTVTYAFKTLGDREAQFGLIGLGGDTGTTFIEALEIVREEEFSDVWTMRVCMHVPYG
ncbi:MAG: hypothetical protein F4X72_09440 [Dehalococcoidia bacterium]|nr:hypothetical protein [Dehalococcoidia bacterium]